MDSEKDARSLTLKTLLALKESKYTLDRIFDDLSYDFEALSIKDISLSKNLIFGILRWQLQIDWIIGNFSKTPLQKINKEILIILRIGIYQIFFLDKIPVSAAVNTSVELSKQYYNGRLKGFVNGVLRNSARNKDGLEFPDIEKDMVKHISVKFSFPEWMIKRWIKFYGSDKTSQICSVINEIPDITIIPNYLLTNREKLAALLSGEINSMRRSYLSESLFISKPKSRIQDLKGFNDGLFKVQDEAAILACEMLSPKPGEKILDACSGIGGKTGTIAFLMGNSGKITASDNVKYKLDQLKSEMKRLKVSIVKTVKKDLTKEILNEKFDKIFLDAPCSGSGVLRRNPDAKWSLSLSKINKNAKRQLKLLLSVSEMLKNGGTILYTVCSTEPEECEGVIKKFLKKRENFKIENFSFKDERRDMLIKEGKYLKTSVLDNGMDGFFAVRLMKK